MSSLSKTASVFRADDRNDRGKPTMASDFLARTSTEPDEMLVRDARAGLSPSQMVERKLLSLLNGRPLPAHHALHTSGRRPARSSGG